MFGSSYACNSAHFIICPLQVIDNLQVANGIIFRPECFMRMTKR